MPSTYVPAAGRPFRERFPFFKFDPSAFLSSPKVARMSPQEIGCYMLLLCQQWLEGSVSADPLELEDLCKGLAPTPLVLRCFERGVDGRLRNPRLDALRRECEERSQARARSGRAGAASGSQPEQQQTGSALQGPGKGEASAHPLPSSSSPGAEHRGGKGEAEREGEGEREVDTGLSGSPLSCNRRSELDTPPHPPEGGGRGNTPSGEPPTGGRRRPRPWEQLLPMIDSERLREAWTVYHRYRAELGVKPWTNSTCQRNLAKATPDQLAAALLEAVDRGWQGVRIENWAPDGSPVGSGAKIRPEGQADPAEHPWDREERLRRERLRSSPPPVPDSASRGLRRLQGGA